MNKIFINILFGILAIIIITVFEFLITLPFGDPGGLASGDYSSFINRELLLTAVPAAVTTFVLSWLLKTKSKSDSLKKAAIWTIMIALSYLLIGIGNDNLSEIFVTIGIYVLLVCAFAGPVIYATIKHLA